MATPESIVKDVIASLNTKAGAPLAAKWVDNRYIELVTKVRFRHLRKIGELIIPATINDGTVAVTRGATTVTGTSTTFETDIGSGSQTAWYIKISSAWYLISSITSDTILELASAFSEDTVTSASYSAVKRFHITATNARWLGDFVLTRLRLPLETISLDELNLRAPGRILTGQFPRIMAQVGVDSNYVITVEFYPASSDSEIVHYVYWNLPSTLSFTTTIPVQVDPHILKEGILIDLYRWEKMQSIMQGNIEAATLMRNEERAQSTRWQAYIDDAVAADRGVDDLTFILKSTRSSISSRPSEMTAHDYVYNRWTWPGLR